MDDNKNAILNKNLILHFNYTYISMKHQDYVMNINFIIY